MGSATAGQPGQMPGGEMRTGPGETQMGGAAAGQLGQMPDEMRAGSREIQMGAVAPSVGPSQTSAAAVDAELTAYLRERQAQ